MAIVDKTRDNRTGMRAPQYTNRFRPIIVIAAAILLLSERRITSGADFRPISTEIVTSNLPYKMYSPVVNITAISGDGRFIAGDVRDTGVVYDCAAFVCGVSPFVWSFDHEQAPSFVNTPATLQFQSGTGETHPYLANSLSFDGEASLVVTQFRHFESAIYRDGQPQLLRPTVNPQLSLWGADLSADGSVAVGNLGEQPFHWNGAHGLTLIPSLPPELPFTASRVSGDGRVIVLNAQSGPFSHSLISLSMGGPRGNAYTWTEDVGLREMQQLPGDDYSTALATSFDGGVLVGSSTSIETNASRSRAVRWEDGGVEELIPLNGHEWSIAMDVTANGELAVGQAYNASHAWLPISFSQVPTIDPATVQAQAVVWDSHGDVFELKSLLESQHGLGAQLEGWLLTGASLISDDGRVIVGQGINPEGVPESWLVRLDGPLNVPEPTSLALLMMAAFLISVRTPALRAIKGKSRPVADHYTSSSCFVTR